LSLCPAGSVRERAFAQFALASGQLREALPNTAMSPRTVFANRFENGVSAAVAVALSAPRPRPVVTIMSSSRTARLGMARSSTGAVAC